MAKKRSSAVINVLIAGDTKKFKKALGRASSSLADFGKKVGQVGAATGVALAGLGAKAVDLAVDFEESLSKTQAIFGDASKSIEASAKGAATAVGLSQAEFLDAASSFGVFGKAAGLTGSELSGFADEMVTVAADVASFNNLRPEEALEKLQAGLRGSNEPLQSIGVLITAAAVNAKALEMGLGDANGEISEGNKIMARQALILEQLGKQGALGDFEKTSEGLANQMRILKARIKNVGIEIGRKLLPFALKAVKVIGRIVGAVRNLIEIFKNKGFAGGFNTIVDAYLKFRDKFLQLLIKLAPKVWKAIKKVAPVIAKALVRIAKDSAKKLMKLGKMFVDWIKPRIRPMLARLWEFIKTIGSFIKEKLPWLAGKIGEIAAAFLAWIGPLVKKLLVNLPTIVKTITVWLATEALPVLVKAAGKLAEKLVPALLEFGVLFLEGVGSIIAQVGGAIGRGFVNMGSYAFNEAGKFGNKILDAMMKPIGFMGDLAKTAFDAVIGAFATGYNALVTAWNATIGGFGFTVPDWLKYTGLGAPIAGKSFKIPELDPLELAKGGLVTGPTLAMIGEAGPEAVIPLNKMGGMGTTNITINMPAGSNGEDIVAALENYVRRNGALPLATTNLVRA